MYVRSAQNLFALDAFPPNFHLPRIRFTLKFVHWSLFIIDSRIKFIFFVNTVSKYINLIIEKLNLVDSTHILMTILGERTEANR